MTLKWIKGFSVVCIFFLCFLTHFMYDWFPNTLFSIFFPVNESIWEHMKMLFSAFIIYGFLEYFVLRFFKQKTNNFLVSLFVSAVSSIPIFLIIYLPFYYLFGENMVLNLIVLFVTIIISEIISYFILSTRNFKNLNNVSIIGVILVYIIFGILTYYPFLNDLFYDTLNEKYGINVYNV